MSEHERAVRIIQLISAPAGYRAVYVRCSEGQEPSVEYSAVATLALIEWIGGPDTGLRQVSPMISDGTFGFSLCVCDPEYFDSGDRSEVRDTPKGVAKWRKLWEAKREAGSQQSESLGYRARLVQIVPGASGYRAVFVRSQDSDPLVEYKSSPCNALVEWVDGPDAGTRVVSPMVSDGPAGMSLCVAHPEYFDSGDSSEVTDTKRSKARWLELWEMDHPRDGGADPQPPPEAGSEVDEQDDEPDDAPLGGAAL